MILTKKQIEEFEEAAKPLIEFLCVRCNPHVTVIVTPTTAEIFESHANIKCEEFIQD